MFDDNDENEVVDKPVGKSLLKRLTMLSVLGVVGVHLVATFLWIAPSSAARDVFPGDSLSNHMTPFFTQGWSVFAPNPVNSDFYFDVRAVVVDADGNEKTTGWVRATDVEIDHDRYGMFSPRAIRMGLKVSTDVKRLNGKLSVEQREVVSKDFLTVDDFSVLEDELLAVGDAGNVSSFVRSDEVATAYASQVALAVWGDGVVRVQYRASEQGVVPFGKRNDEDAVRPDVYFADTGWRGVLVKDGQDSEKFAEYFCSSDKVVCVK